MGIGKRLMSPRFTESMAIRRITWDNPNCAMSHEIFAIKRSTQVIGITLAVDHLADVDKYSVCKDKCAFRSQPKGGERVGVASQMLKMGRIPS